MIYDVYLWDLLIGTPAPTRVKSGAETPLTLDGLEYSAFVWDVGPAQVQLAIWRK